MQRRRGWGRKFADAFRGLSRALRSQSSFVVHLAAAAAALGLAAMLGVSAVEWAVLAATIGAVLAAEVFNTAIESLARAFGPARHPRIRDALDMASAAVLVTALAAIAVGLALFLPRLAAMLGG